MKKPTYKAAALGCSLLAMTMCVTANDLNDGIALGESLDDRVKPDTNWNYIVAKAKGRPGAEAMKSEKNAGVGNINIGPGADLSNTTIINTSKNKDATVVSK